MCLGTTSWHSGLQSATLVSLLFSTLKIWQSIQYLTDSPFLPTCRSFTKPLRLTVSSTSHIFIISTWLIQFNVLLARSMCVILLDIYWGSGIFWFILNSSSAHCPQNNGSHFPNIIFFLMGVSYDPFGNISFCICKLLVQGSGSFYLTHQYKLIRLPK